MVCASPSLLRQWLGPLALRPRRDMVPDYACRSLDEDLSTPALRVLWSEWYREPLVGLSPSSD